MRFRIKYATYKTSASPCWMAFYEQDYVYAACYCEGHTLEEVLEVLRKWFLDPPEWSTNVTPRRKPHALE